MFRYVVVMFIALIAMSIIQSGEAQCPPGFDVTNCSSHGSCVLDPLDLPICDCDGNWGGLNCSYTKVVCPNNCTSPERGTCNDRTGVCLCIRGTGADCSGKEECPNNCNKHGVCFEGICSCDAGWIGSGCGVNGNDPEAGMSHGSIAFAVIMGLILSFTLCFCMCYSIIKGDN